MLAQPGSPASRELLADHVSGREPLVAPELLHYELCNALVVRARMPATLARQAYDNFANLEIETYSLGVPEYDRAIGLAAERGITAYDAAYGALAQALGCRLATADRRLAAALKPLGIADLV
jgi:predicted nucleic acid-binding protein